MFDQASVLQGVQGKRNMQIIPHDFFLSNHRNYKVKKIEKESTAQMRFLKDI